MTADAAILSDAEAAQRRAADPEASVWVAASAGTGKTKVLTDRVLSLMLTGTRPQHILCLTFTRAAAAEMSNRIAEELGAWAAADDEKLEKILSRHLGRQPDDDIRRRARRLFAQVLDTPGGMNIQTLTALCQSPPGPFPLGSVLPPPPREVSSGPAGVGRMGLARVTSMPGASSANPPTKRRAYRSIDGQRSRGRSGTIRTRGMSEKFRRLRCGVALLLAHNQQIILARQREQPRQQ